MNKKQAKRLFDKYVKNECSAREIELLNKYLESFQDKKRPWSELPFDETIKKKLWLKIRSEIRREKPVKNFAFQRYLKYAAIFAAIAGGLLWYQLNRDSTKSPSGLVTDSPIILKTSDKNVAQIDTEGENALKDERGKVIGNQKGNKISYTENTEITELVYNEILVPNGKKIQLELSDGTTVHINSSSSLRFPIHFISGQERQVFLKGEAYFEVAKDTIHPFRVTTNDMGIKVLGTHFNVNSYKEMQPFAVLAEGSVAIYNQKSGEVDPIIIQPGEKASMASDIIEVTEVNLNDYLGWKDGRLSFNNESFKDIIHKIERHYGVTIENEYTALNPVKFRGAFKEETIIDLLDTFKESAGFNYGINNNKIVIYDIDQ